MMRIWSIWPSPSLSTVSRAMTVMLVEGLIEMPAAAQGPLVGRLQEVVTVAAPASVLPAPLVLLS
jgi:hypothetical protein